MSADEHLNGQQFGYHVASSEARQSIQSHGLDWQQGPRADDDDYATDMQLGRPPVANYFHNTLAAAQDMHGYLSEDSGEPHDIYKVKTSGLSLRPDPYQPEDATYTRQPVSPSRITRL